MSTFLVEQKTIAEVLHHPNADRLEVAKFKDLGYSLVVAKGQFQPGDRIVYIPLDAVLPEEISAELGVKPYLGGKDHNVVQTAVLRGVASQGLPAPITLLTNRGISPETPAEEIAGLLGITKYDPEPKEAENATLLPLPGNRNSYDIENAERLADVVAYVIANHIEVVVTEKLEGCHIGVYADETGTTRFIRNNAIHEDEGKINPICELIRKTGLEKIARAIFARYEKPVSLHAEALGPGSGSNYYELPIPMAPVFDIGIREVSGWTYAGEDELAALAIELKFLRSPKLFQGQLADFLGGQNFPEASHGKSTLNIKKLREGIVIKPVKEQSLPLELLGGRLILKQRDPIYLGKAR